MTFFWKNLFKRFFFSVKKKKEFKIKVKKMLLGTQNHCANLAASKGATDFSIAAIMARGPSSREPSERSLSE